jgi:excinuclease ABC subunit B
VYERDYYTVEVEAPAAETFASPADLARRIAEMEAAMREAARRLDFEQAADLRDRVKALKRQQVS